MLTLSSKSMQAFDEYAVRMFEDEMVTHLQGFAPKLCEIATEKRVRKVIRYGIERAALCGFTNRGPVRFFLELMFSFGCHFDTDPQHVWAREFLQKDFSNQHHRARQLFEMYSGFVDQTIGRNNVIQLAALRKIESLQLEPLEIDGNRPQQDLFDIIRSIYPERIDAVGTSDMVEVIDSSIRTAEKYRVNHPSSLLISTLMTLFIGWHYDSDPLYFWIGDTINNQSGVDPDDRFKSVFQKSQIYIRGVIRYWESKSTNLDNGYV